ncbi:class I adenylate-forming enzyme family protein [Paenibacillus arenilitoris]|uniref:Acyl--CoA ligase n=1 Tax=Paenibacillus arenilitoris TaxID=2772299 RepID=A0A927CRE2_9BACL|nr:class I adenylate-forming enzyme family protein [Paenibacillus arenilitoris]MBD2872759.1 acyl--CoA ligase [Paenibacillus arenilitoris]
MKRTSDFNPDTIPYLLRKRAADCANDVAYSFPAYNQHYAWSTLWREVRLLAKGLLKLGIKKGDAVAVLMPGRMETIVSMFAAACVGAVIVPLNTYSKKEELRHYLEDARPAALLMATKGNRLHYPAILQEIIFENRRAGTDSSWLPAHIFVLDDEESAAAPFRSYSDLFALGSLVEEETLAAACRANRPEDPLILLYTSGTLGMPKGVLRTTASFLLKKAQAAGPGPGSALLSKLTDRITRYFSVMNLLPLYHLGGFATLFTGLKACNIRIVMLSRFHPIDALAAVQMEKCKVLIGTPFMIQQMLASPQRRDYDLKSVLGIAFTSAAVNNAILQKMMKQIDLRFFMVSYGSSEAGAVANGTCFIEKGNNGILPLLYNLLKPTNLLSGLLRYQDFEKSEYSIGGRIDKAVEVKIVDPDTGRTLPPSAHGEIAIRSYRVMRYTKENKERPCFTEDGWYRSGDLGFVDERRQLTITGRLHRIISRGGEKISPVEIENALLRLGDVAEALVIGVPDELYGEQVCACVVAKHGAALSADKLRSDLAPLLSAFKLPRHFVFLPAFPLSPTGKISVAEIKSLVLDGNGALRKHA